MFKDKGVRMMDFTLKKYDKILKALGPGDYSFKNFLEGKSDVVLRHDVERRPVSALRMAIVEKENNVISSYYFRVPYSYDAKIIDKIYDLGHEIGFHYETLAKANGDYSKAFDIFKDELRLFEKWDIKTIAMHGSPITKYSNKELWNRYDFHTLGIIGEAYMDTDFSKIAYITDTGRGWNKTSVSVRDKVANMPKIKDSDDLISKLKKFKKVYITTHPHRWTDNMFMWTHELVWQNAKNVGKRILIKVRK